MKTLEKALKTCSKCRWDKEKGLFKVTDNKELYIANFFPVVLEVQDMEDDKIIILRLYHVFGTESEIQIPIKRLRNIDWFELCQQCVVNEESKEMQVLLKQIVRMQVAEFEGESTKITYYRQLGWNRDADGKPVYVFGNGYVGGDKKAIVAPFLKRFELQLAQGQKKEKLQAFVELLEIAPFEATMTLGYFFTGIIRQLYKEAGIPVGFVLYLLGEQQNRKTTLAKLTNNLYCRNSDMEFSLRTVEKTSCTVAEKEIAMFKDTTLILDDVSKTGNKKYRQTQENVVEKVTRLIGNRTKKSSNIGNGIKEYFPNANVIITGEYLPPFPESTLSRMLIVEIKEPVDAMWLTKIEQDPLMISTVAWLFISWVQIHYAEIITLIRKNFQMYRQSRVEEQPYQERIQEHGFILSCTFYIFTRFLCESGYMDRVINSLQVQMNANLHAVLEEQVEIMQRYASDTKENDYCKIFVKLYRTELLSIAEDKVDYNDSINDGFMKKGKYVCVKSAKLCAIMQKFYKDETITIQAVVKQFRNNRFLKMDQSDKSSKKEGGERFLFIRRCMIEDYADFIL